jgi:hypothetical protein
VRSWGRDSELGIGLLVVVAVYGRDRRRKGARR